MQMGQDFRTMLPRMLLMFFLVNSVHSRLFSREISVWYNRPGHTSYHSLTSYGFGFLSGGSVHLTMTCPAAKRLTVPSFWLMMCNNAEARELSRYTPNMLSYDCLSMENARRNGENVKQGLCKRFSVGQNSSTLSGYYTLNGRVNKQEHYVFMLLQCTSSGIPETNPKDSIPSRLCQTDLMLMNPGGQHLSSDEMPLPIIYMGLSIIWSVLLGAWFINCLLFMKFSNRLHKLVTCAPLCKLVVVILVMLQWHEVSTTGTNTSDLTGVGHFLSSMEDSLLFFIMLVAAEGWGVLHKQMPNYRWATLSLLFAVFATSLLCVYWVHKYFLAFAVCCVVFILYKTLKWTTHNIDILGKRRKKMQRFVSRLSLSYQSKVTIDEQLEEKEQLYHRYRVMASGFCILYAIAVTLATFLQDYSYIRALAFELPEMIMCLCLGFLFRLRNFDPYERIELHPPRETCVVVEAPEVSAGTADVSYMIGLPVTLISRTENELITSKKSVWKVMGKR